MKWSKQQQLENESRLAFKALLPKEWIVRDKQPDIGIDMEIEFVRGGEVENRLLLVQLKATQEATVKNGKIPFLLDTKHLKYYETAQLPLIIVLWSKSDNIFYYLFAQRYIKEELSMQDPEWRTKSTKTIYFLKSSTIDKAEIFSSISVEWYLYAIQQQLNLKPEADSAFYWIDGIPWSDDEELKERVLRAFSCLRKNDYLKAISEFEGALRACTTSPKQKMVILLCLGNAYYTLRQLEAAYDNYVNVLELAPKVKERDALIGQGYALGNIGMIYFIRSDFANALKCHKEALDLSSKLDDKRLRSNALNSLAGIYKETGDFNTALVWLKKALIINKEIGDKSGEAMCLCNIGTIYEEKSEIGDALTCFEESLKISQEINFKLAEAHALANIGLILSSKGDTEKGLIFYEKALRINHEIGNVEAEAENLSNMGLIQGDYCSDQALKTFKKSLKIYKKIGNLRGQASSLGNIGLVHLDRGTLNEALHCFRKALEIDKKIGNKEGTATDLSDIGLVYKAQGDLDNALRYYEESLKIDHEIGRKKGEVDDLCTLGLIYLDKGDALNALRYLVDASVIVDKFGLEIDREAIQSLIDKIAAKYC